MKKCFQIVKDIAWNWFVNKLITEIFLTFFYWINNLKFNDSDSDSDSGNGDSEFKKILRIM